MFVFNRSAFPVLLPLALLMAVVIWSNRSAPADTPAAGAALIDHSATVAQAAQPGQKGG
jgi:hypothetical protein